MELLDLDHRVGIEPDTALNAGEDRDVNLEMSHILPLHGEIVDVWIVSHIVGQVAYWREVGSSLSWLVKYRRTNGRWFELLYKSERLDLYSIESCAATIGSLYACYERGEPLIVVVEKDTYIQWFHSYVVEESIWRLVNSCHIVIDESGSRGSVEEMLVPSVVME